MQQTTDTILMIRPVNFRMNEETAVNNYFQEDLDIKNAEINRKALEEFDEFVEKLRAVGINVIVESDDKLMDTPDSIFPNNWVSFHGNGDVAIYPMFAKNRRKERRDEVFIRLENEGFKIENIIDYTSAEDEGIFLEGTGSLLLDRVNSKAYCALSPRADEDLFIEFCEDFEYTPVVFTANQTVNNKREAIYHTNVMMCVAETFAIVCLSSIDDKKERKNVLKHLKEDKKQVIDITEEQVNNFAGNMLQVENKKGELFIIMSRTALDALDMQQREVLGANSKILAVQIPLIEQLGGGSARCMLAEVFLEKKI